MLRADPGCGEARAHCRGRRRIAARGPVENRRHAVEPAQLVLGGERRVVGDVIGISGKAIEGVDMDAKIATDQPGADRKILVASPFARGRLDTGSPGGGIGRCAGVKRGHRT